MGLRDYVAVLRKRWLSIAVITVIVTAFAAVISYTTPKVYSATAQNFVALTGDSNDSSVLTGAQFAAQRVKSYTEIVSSPDVLQPVITELALPYSAGSLASRVTVTNPPGTVLLMVTAVDGSPEAAATIANAVSIQLGRVIEKLETPTTQSVAPVKVTLTEPAVPPNVPSSPKIRSNVLLGFLIGLGLGVAWAFVRNTLDNTVKSPRELDDLARAPSLGAVLFDANAKHQVLSALDSKAIQSEGYRTIRTNLQFVNVDSPVSAFVVTSAAPGDGKTTIACNLAIALAQTGKKVCLVESDLRRPRVMEYLELPAGPGLTEVLAGQLKLEDALRPWGGGMLSVLPPGALPPNPSEILGSHQMEQVISNLRASFDMVILDTPPLLAVSDAAVLSAQTDGAVVVVRYGKSTRDSVRNAVGALEQINADVLGSVLNAVPTKRGNGYGYGYGYGQGYGYEKKRKGKPDSAAEKGPAKENVSARPDA